MTNLFEFTATEAPEYERAFPVAHPVDPTAFAGFVGPCSRGGMCFVTTRRRYPNADGEQQYYRKGEGYALSETVIGRLLNGPQPVETVLIEVTDTGDVLEYDLAQFRNGERIEYVENDPQRLVPVSASKHIWGV